MMNLHHAPIRVAGIGETAPATADPRSIPEMVLEAVESALADAGMTHDRIDAVVTASVDMFDGLTASNIAVTEVVGAVMKPETRIAADGLGALIHGCCQLAAGAYGTVLVAAHGKPSMADYQGLTQWAMDPIHIQPLGVDFLTCAALQARVLAWADPDCEGRWAAIVARRRAAAGDAGLLPPCSEEEAANSPAIASPIREEMRAPLADGACAVVLSSSVLSSSAPGSSVPSRGNGGAKGAKGASGAKHPGVFITGLGHDLESHGLGERNLAQWEGLGRACGRAYAQAGLENPAHAFDFAEPSCLYPHEEQLFVAAAGLSEETPISPRGGLFAGAVPVAAGLSRLIAAVRRMREKPGETRALAHGAWGPAGQGQAVAILAREAS